jgi:tRNA threonylcarbamoyladenosine biosynthesis protein TsaE
MLCIQAQNVMETEAAGRRLASLLRPGDVVALKGNLGAGKTVFVRGIAQGLGCDASLVSSPTFALIHEYKNSTLPLCHMDAYRLDGPDDLPDTGFFDYIDDNWAAAIEWSEKIASAIEPAFTVTLTPIGQNRRKISIEGRGV